MALSIYISANIIINIYNTDTGIVFYTVNTPLYSQSTYSTSHHQLTNLNLNKTHYRNEYVIETIKYYKMSNCAKKEIN